MEELPNYFDVIVVGTGMPECIIAAAAARVGKKVLHLDRNGYYGGDWASFSFDKFMEWIEEKKAEEDIQAQSGLESTLASFLNEGENLVVCPKKSKSITDLCLKSYIRERPEPSATINNECQVAVNSNEVLSHNENPTEVVESGASLPALSPEESGISPEQLEENIASVNQNESNTSAFNNSNNQVEQQEWTISGLMENRRKFNIDLTPKIMFSRGPLVELLISSNIARYAEFQCVNRVLTYIKGHIEQVPCSRADVFSTKNVSVVEKRMLMKFLTFCSKFEEQEEEYRGFEDKPFLDFLRSKKLTTNVEHYIIHAIAMVDDTYNTLQGLKATQKFLLSLGRYGKSPFLCTCYGSAELPQCFCRLCAVYEGMYYLKRDVDAVILSDRCCGIVSMQQRINCQWLVMESSYAAPEFLPSENPLCLSRAILITDGSLCPSEKKENTLLRLPSGQGIENAVTVLELSSKNYVCPEDLYLVYMVCRSSGVTAEEDLKPAVDLLFKTADLDSEEVQKSNYPRPNLLWCFYYRQKDTSTINLNSRIPQGLFLTSSSDIGLDYDHTVKEAQEIFEIICPGEEFLPRAPDPEDILIEQHNNPGNDSDGEKTENDYIKPDVESPENMQNSETAKNENENNDEEQDSLNSKNKSAGDDGENNTES